MPKTFPIKWPFPLSILEYCKCSNSEDLHRSWSILWPSADLWGVSQDHCGKQSNFTLLCDTGCKTHWMISQPMSYHMQAIANKLRPPHMWETPASINILIHWMRRVVLVAYVACPALRTLNIMHHTTTISVYAIPNFLHIPTILYDTSNQGSLYKPVSSSTVLVVIRKWRLRLIEGTRFFLVSCNAKPANSRVQHKPCIRLFSNPTWSSATIQNHVPYVMPQSSWDHVFYIRTQFASQGCCCSRLGAWVPSHTADCCVMDQCRHGETLAGGR